MKNKWTISTTLTLLASFVVFTGCKSQFPKDISGNWSVECKDKYGDNTHPDVDLFWYFELDPTGGGANRFVQQEVDAGGGATYAEGTFMYVETGGVLQIQDPASGTLLVYNLIQMSGGYVQATGIGESCVMSHATTVTSIPSKK